MWCVCTRARGSPDRPAMGRADATILGIAWMASEHVTPAALDLNLLDRQTFGDRELAADLLELFELQALRLWPTISGSGEPQARSDAAHTLKGGAAAIGAAEVMRIAGELEVRLVAEEAEPTELLASLAAAIDETCQAIAGWRRAG